MILVTGGTGLVGFHVIDQLRKKGYKVRALVRSREKGKRILPEECELAEGDVLRKDSLKAALKNCTAVFHAAGIPEQWASDPQIFQKINVEGTANMVEAALEASVSKFVYTSTIDVFYGEKGKEYDESRLDQNPKGTAYERSKQEADRLVVAAVQKGLPAIFIHPAAVYGPGPAGSPGINDFMEKIYYGKIPMLLPGGMPVVYAPDLGMGQVLAFEKAKTSERFIFSERYLTLKEMSEIISQELGKKKAPTVMPTFLAQGVSLCGEFLSRFTGRPPLIPSGQLHFLRWQSLPNGRRAETQLGVKYLPFQEGVKRTVEYLGLVRPGGPV